MIHGSIILPVLKTKAISSAVLLPWLPIFSFCLHSSSFNQPYLLEMHVSTVLQWWLTWQTPFSVMAVGLSFFPSSNLGRIFSHSSLSWDYLSIYVYSLLFSHPELPSPSSPVTKAISKSHTQHRVCAQSFSMAPSHRCSSFPSSQVSWSPTCANEVSLMGKLLGSHATWSCAHILPYSWRLAHKVAQMTERYPGACAKELASMYHSSA